jgi:hypothetical protein
MLYGRKSLFDENYYANLKVKLLKIFIFSAFSGHTGV